MTGLYDVKLFRIIYPHQIPSPITSEADSLWCCKSYSFWEIEEIDKTLKNEIKFMALYLFPKKNVKFQDLLRLFSILLLSVYISRC